MRTGIDILETEIVEIFPEILNILLCDRTTQKNIFWATDNYSHIGELYNFGCQILPDLITGDFGSIIMPRVHKDKILQLSRSKEMAEVFTPSWVCNMQNNLADNAWFGKENIFNKDAFLENGAKTWETTTEKILFPEGKTWEDYIRKTCLEITCGEAPYLVSRYDTTTGAFIPIDNRIGLLDRKMRVINENTNSEEEWLSATETAYQNIYGFEWQGDSLLLAREALFITFVEHYTHRFGKEPALSCMENIANIISWNIWQMDGLKGVVPKSCHDTFEEKEDLFGDIKKETVKCKGCALQYFSHHNGIYATIMDWEKIDEETGKKGKVIKYIDLLNK